MMMMMPTYPFFQEDRACTYREYRGLLFSIRVTPASPTDRHPPRSGRLVYVSSPMAALSVELYDDIKEDLLIMVTGIDDGIAGNAPGTHLPTGVPSNSPLSGIPQSNALKHVSHEDNLAHAVAVGDLAGIYHKNYCENILAACASWNNLYEHISESVPCIGILYKDGSNSAHFGTANRGHYKKFDNFL